MGKYEVSTVRKLYIMWQADLRIVRLLFFTNLILLILVPLYYISLSAFGLTLAIGLYFLFGALGIVATFHRFYSHRTFTFRRKITEKVWSLLGHLTGSGSAVGWVALHRLHHGHTDTKKDPHSTIHGLWKTMTLDYNFELNQWRGIKDMLSEPYIRFFHNYYFAILLIYGLCLFIPFGIEGIYYGFIVPSVITILMSGLTNYAAHIPRLGYRTYATKETSTNAWWLALFNCGEGWHNNHHQEPHNFTTKHKWGEFDMAGSLIRFVKQ